jgi:hypothetical protein
LQQRVEVLNTADELSAAIKDIWENLSVDYIQGLYHLMPNVWERCHPEINSPALENVSQSQAINFNVFMSIYRAIHCRNCPHTVV